MTRVRKDLNCVSKRHKQRLVKAQIDKINQCVITMSLKSSVSSISSNNEYSNKLPDISTNIFNNNEGNNPQLLLNNHQIVTIAPRTTANDRTDEYFSIDDFRENDRQNTSSSIHNNNLDLALEIRNWAISACLNKKVVSDLLKILQKYGHKDLPSDARTLLKTSKSVKLIDMKPGKYYHFGLCKGLIQSALTYYTSENLPEEIKFNTHVDGLPLSKSSSTQMWPILASIYDNFYTEPFIVGAYVGDTKPADCNDFLKYYCEEVEIIKETGLYVKEQKISCSPYLFIADAPARAYIMCIKYHSGYNSCSFCIQEGEYIKNRVTFPEINAPLRSDESFARKLDDDHHRGTSILETLNIGMVSQFPIDYMHNVVIGVVKSLLRGVVYGKQDVRMTKPNIDEASNHLVELRNSIPHEFARKPRPLIELDRYKATELRQILLYTGPVIFWKRLPDDKYYHFLSLSIAIRILCSEEFHKTLNDYARSLLIYYVENYGKLYGAEHVTWNIHNLIHLCDIALRLGPLDKYSAFKYENYLQKVKKKVKTSGKELQQLVNRLTEETELQKSLPMRKHTETNYPIITFTGEQEMGKQIIKSLEYKEFLLNKKKKNSCIYIDDGSIVQIVNMYFENNVVYICGKKYIGAKAMFVKPCESTALKICVVSKHKVQDNIILPASRIQQKCVKLKLNINESAVFPLLHKD